MDSQARVASLDRVEEFRASYAKFGESARQALLGVDLEIRRMLEWLEKDMIAYWKGEIRRREEKVNEAKAALHRKRITAAFGNTVADTDEVVQLRKAKARLDEAEEKMKAVKQWQLVVEQEVSEYRAPAQVLGNLLDADVPRALSLLSRMLETLESYLQVTAPSSEASQAAELASVAMPVATPTEAAAVQAAASEGLDGAAPGTDADAEGAA